LILNHQYAILNEDKGFEMNQMYSPALARPSLLVAIVSIAAFTAAPVYAQGEECIGIENDIARLHCFDGAFTNITVLDTLTREEAVAALSKLVNYRSSTEVFTLQSLGTPCQIEFQYLSSKAIVNFGRQYIEGFSGRTDLSFVEGIEEFLWYGNPIGFTISMERDNSSLVIYRAARLETTTPIDATQLSIESIPVQGDGIKNERELRVNMIVSEYIPDSQKIGEALQAAIDVCHAN